MARTQDELRNIFNQGTAADADFDEYVSSGYSRDVLGPKSQAEYDKAVARAKAKSTPAPDKVETPQEPVNQPSVAVEEEQPSADDIMKETRKQYANDNEGYKKALADKGIEIGDSRSKVRSIQQAYYDGAIDKGTRDYMMADALAKFARNTGRDIGNIGAQYTGGTVNNNYEEADWNKRNDELFKQQTSSEAADVKGSDKAMERSQQQANLTGQNLGNEKASRSLEFSRQLQREAAEARKKGDTKRADVLQYMASKGANSLSMDELVALGLLEDGRDSRVASGEMTASEAAMSDVDLDRMSELKNKDYPDVSDEFAKQAMNKYFKDLENGVDSVVAEREFASTMKNEQKRLSTERKAKEAEATRQQNLANAFKDKIAAVDTFKKLTNKKTVDGSKFDLNRYRSVRDVVQKEHPEMFDGSVADADAQALIAKMYYGVQ